MENEKTGNQDSNIVSIEDKRNLTSPQLVENSTNIEPITLVEVGTTGPDNKQLLGLELSQPEAKCYICGNFGFHICKTCGLPHCAEHTSNVDFSDCSKCCTPVDINISKTTKTEEDYDEVTDETVIKSYEARHIQFGGEHWLNNSIIIASLSDPKLRGAIEYHKGMVHLMEDELVNRRIAKAHKRAQAPVIRRKKHPSLVTSVETTKTTRVRRKSTASPADKIAALMDTNNIDPQKLIDMLQAKLAQRKTS